MTRRLSLPLCILLIIATSVFAGAQPEYVKLTLLSTNDLHAHIWPFNHPDTLVGRIPHTKNVGGVARRAWYVNRVRAEATWPVLLLDSGDTTYSGSPFSKAFHGLVDIDVMNAMDYIAMAPGNHDFQYPAEHTLNNLKASRFPWISANFVEEKTGKPFLPPYIIREYDGLRVAFLGLITSLANAQGYKATHELGLRQIDAIEVASKLVPELRKQADIIVCLSHLGWAEDAKLAKAVPGIDIILGGHSHSRCVTPRMVSVGTPTAYWIGAVPVVQAYCHGSEMGHTDVIFRRDPKTGSYTLMSCKGTLVSLDSSVPDDPAIARLVERWEAKRRALLPPTAPAPAAAK